MTSVRDRVYELLRGHGVTTVFGNPGYTELPFLAGFPHDFTYYLGLQEASVIGMADGFSQASRRPVLVNLHNAPGVGNAMGNLQAAFHNGTPLIVTAGQQRRDMQVSEPGFYARDARDLPKPYVKWSYEPACAAEVPAAVQRAILTATTPPTGPVFLSLPLDDWEADAPETPLRRVHGRCLPDPDALRMVARRLANARAPALIAGAGVDRACGFDALAALADKLRAAVFSAPVAARAGFPEHHPLFRGGLPFVRGGLRERLKGHDVILVLGAAVFDYEPYQDGPVLPEEASLLQLTDDPETASRALVGDTVLGDVGLAIRGLIELLPQTARNAPPPQSAPPKATRSGPLTGDAVFACLEAVRPPDSVIVLEAPSHASAMHRQVKVREAVCYFNEGVAGLGYGLPCAVGVQLARPERRVICAIGDGAFCYSPQALWTAAQHGVPVIVLILDDGGYEVLKASGDFLGVGYQLPGLEVPGVDHGIIARGFGVPGTDVSTEQELADALAAAFRAQGPALVRVRVGSDVRPLLS